MYILNPTDETIRQGVAETAPLVNGSEERHTPPKTYALPPRKVIEVPDVAGEFITRKLKNTHGVVRVRPDDDIAELTREGRRRWRQWVEQSVGDFEHESQRRQAAGGLAAVPTNGWLHARVALLKRLRAEEAAEVAKLLGNEAVPPPVVETPAAPDQNDMGFGLSAEDLQRRRRAFLNDELEGEAAAAAAE